MNPIDSVLIYFQAESQKLTNHVSLHRISNFHQSPTSVEHWGSCSHMESILIKLQQTNTTSLSIFAHPAAPPLDSGIVLKLRKLGLIEQPFLKPSHILFWKEPAEKSKPLHFPDSPYSLISHDLKDGYQLTDHLNLIKRSFDVDQKKYLRKLKRLEQKSYIQLHSVYNANKQMVATCASSYRNGVFYLFSDTVHPLWRDQGLWSLCRQRREASMSQTKVNWTAFMYSIHPKINGKSNASLQLRHFIPSAARKI